MALGKIGGGYGSLVFMVSVGPGYLSSVPWYKSILQYIRVPGYLGSGLGLLGVIRAVGVTKVV